jgi:flagellar basal-body rod protein FlgB
VSIDAIIGTAGSVLHSTLDGLAERRRVIADNVANIQTPGFQAGQVDFETSLRAVLTDGTGSDVSAAARSVTPTGLRSTAPSRLDGNNVNLDNETMLDIETGLRYQQAIRALDDRFGLLRTSLRTA